MNDDWEEVSIPYQLDHVPVHNDITCAPTKERTRSFEQLSGWKMYGPWPPGAADETCIPHWIILGHRSQPCFGDGCWDGPELHALDHARAAVAPGGIRVLLAQPYSFDSKDAAELTKWCERFEFEWCVNGFSSYWPGRTVTLVVGREVAESRRRLQCVLPWPDKLET